MAQITGNNNQYLSYQLSFKIGKVFSEPLKIFLLKILTDNKLPGYNILNGDGFLPYSFGNSNINQESKLEDSTYENMLILSHFSIHQKQRKKISEDIKEKLQDEEHDSSLDQYIRKNIIEDYFDRYVQDFIFIDNDDQSTISLIIPSSNPSDTINFLINPYIDHSIQVNPHPKNHLINSELLDWLVWDIKRKKNGVLEKIRINFIEEFSSSAFLTSGALNIKIEDADQTLYSKLAGGLSSHCNKITLGVSFEGRQYKFKLGSGGFFTPNWSGCSGYKTKVNCIDRILYIRDISTKIIPLFSNAFQEMQPDWIKNKDEIFKELREEVKESI